ncbi:tyrosine-type recombinase/integrase [Streptomyces sp. NPDC001530]|uniref:tyrosine-type recombinase/integrase n=1 Tax=Streptomyces sp. NPDC001530 TaxID=3364582 RepID=UPI0036773C71
MVRPRRRQLRRQGLRAAPRQAARDLADIKWDPGRFGTLHVRHGKGARGSGPRERMVPLINGADRTLRWFIGDVWGQFDDEHTCPGAPLFPSEPKNTDGSSRRVGDDALRNGLVAAAKAHLPGWAGKLTPHVLRHFCASELSLSGLDLLAIQGVLGHSWIATTMRHIHVQQTRGEDASAAGQQLAAKRLEGLVR